MNTSNLFVRFIFFLMAIDHSYSLYQVFETGDHSLPEKIMLVIFRVAMAVIFLGLTFSKTNQLFKKSKSN